MIGADKYYDIFNGKSQQIGRLYLQFHTHARGKCFEIFLLPEERIEKGDRLSSFKDVVEVYGMTQGQRGWTEEYGWIHKGKWVDDFYKIVAAKEIEIEKKRLLNKESSKQRKEEKESNTKKLLSNYK